MIRITLHTLICCLVSLPQCFCAYCGSAGVPFSFEVTASGAPVLGCAQPSCVAGPDDLGDESSFPVNVKGQIDGFVRDGDKELKRYRTPSSPRLIANCSGHFNEFSCPMKNQWVGGIEYIDHHRQPLALLLLQCCTFDGLKYSQEVGVTNVKKGEAVIGGEVIRYGRQISFDVIANVRKVYDKATKEVSYEVTVRRMNCLPDPPEPEIPVDKDAPAEITKVLKNANNGISPKIPENFVKKESVLENRAFGAPALKVAIVKKHPKLMKTEENGAELDDESNKGFEHKKTSSLSKISGKNPENMGISTSEKNLESIIKAEDDESLEKNDSNSAEVDESVLQNFSQVQKPLKPTNSKSKLVETNAEKLQHKNAAQKLLPKLHQNLPSLPPHQLPQQLGLQPQQLGSTVVYQLPQLQIQPMKPLLAPQFPQLAPQPQSSPFMQLTAPSSSQQLQPQTLGTFQTPSTSSQMAQQALQMQPSQSDSQQFRQLQSPPQLQTQPISQLVPVQSVQPNTIALYGQPSLLQQPGQVQRQQLQLYQTLPVQQGESSVQKKNFHQEQKSSTSKVNVEEMQNKPINEQKISSQQKKAVETSEKLLEPSPEIQALLSQSVPVPRTTIKPPASAQAPTAFQAQGIYQQPYYQTYQQPFTNVLPQAPNSLFPQTSPSQQPSSLPGLPSLLQPRQLPQINLFPSLI
uniref:Uncharacterized protein n=1 Tax=Syphacia muris TaxID=451379 RepID=A0A0N5AFX1_9BILA